MKKHLLVLLAVTVLARGVMFVSFPFSGQDDNQAGQLYLIDQLLDGNLLIGNLRYNTGYPYFMAPVWALAQYAGPLNDRITLAVQVGLSATIPFFIYDMLRRTRSSGEGFVVAVLVAADPFGLQWAHFTLPEWLIAFLFTLALWLFVIARQRGRMLLVLTAGAVMALAVLARLNAAVLALLLPLVLWWPKALRFRRKIALTAGYLSVILALVITYAFVVQRPATGTTSLSCISGLNLIEAVETRGLKIQAEHGPASTQYRQLLARPAVAHYGFLADTYGLWQQPMRWISSDAFHEVMGRPPLHPFGSPDGLSMMDLVYVLGPCPLDALQRSVFFETVGTDLIRYLTGTAYTTVDVLLQRNAPFGMRQLPTVGEVGEFGQTTAGFVRASGGYYTGQWVWLPGIGIFEKWFALNEWLKVLIMPAIVWALFSRKLVYCFSALVLLAVAASTALVEIPEARLYALVWMLWPVIIGGMLYAIAQRLRRSKLAVRAWSPSPS